MNDRPGAYPRCLATSRGDDPDYFVAWVFHGGQARSRYQPGGWQGNVLTAANWRERVRERLRQMDLSSILSDVRPFVEPGFDLSLLTLANLERVLGE